MRAGGVWQTGVCRKGRSSPVPQVRARPEEMGCVGSKLGRDMLLAASIVKSSVPKADGINRTVSALYLHKNLREKRTAVKSVGRQMPV